MQNASHIINSLHPHKDTKVSRLFPFYRRISSMPKVTKLEGGKARMRTRQYLSYHLGWHSIVLSSAVAFWKLNGRWCLCSSPGGCSLRLILLSHEKTHNFMWHCYLPRFAPYNPASVSISLSLNSVDFLRPLCLCTSPYLLPTAWLSPPYL